MLRTLQTADIAGIRAIAVHAKDERARRYYEQFDFVAPPGQTRKIIPHGGMGERGQAGWVALVMPVPPYLIVRAGRVILCNHLPWGWASAHVQRPATHVPSAGCKTRTYMRP